MSVVGGWVCQVGEGCYLGMCREMRRGLMDDETCSS